MPIGIVQPAEGTPFGPGFRIQAFTDLIGPLPIDTQWWFLLLPIGEEADWHMADAITSQEHNVFVAFMSESGQTQPPQVAREGVTHGNPASLLVQRREGSTIVESARVNITVDMLTGMPLYQERRQQQVAPTAGFTEQDRVVLQGIESAWIWELVGELLPEVWQALTSRVRTDPHRRLYDPDRAGEGELTKPQTGFFIKWVGIEWQLIEIPVGVGFDEGNPDTEEIDFMQITSMRRLNDGSEIFDSTHYENRPNASWYWGFQEPSRLTYYILPGALVRFYALIQLEPVAAAGLVTPNAH